MGELNILFKEDIEHIFTYLQKVPCITVQEVWELKDKAHTTIVKKQTFLKKGY